MLLGGDVAREGITGPRARPEARPGRPNAAPGDRLHRADWPHAMRTIVVFPSGPRTPMLWPMPVRHPLVAARLVAAIAATLLLGSIAAAPAFAADPRTGGGPVQTSVRPVVDRVRTVDVSRAGAAVTQYTSYWCVPAATQTMLNLVRGTSDRTYATQARLYRELRAANKYRYPTLGNDVRGWARVLTAHLPAGRGYSDHAFASRADAYDAIVDSLDATGRPVGIVVDRGSHAWTVVGFKVAEQVGVRVPTSRTILGFYVIGPLGAGRDPWPKAYYTVDQLSMRFTRYHESTRAVVWEGLYVIVEPLHPLGASVTSR